MLGPRLERQEAVAPAIIRVSILAAPAAHARPGRSTAPTLRAVSRSRAAEHLDLTLLIVSERPLNPVSRRDQRLAVGMLTPTTRPKRITPIMPGPGRVSVMTEMI